MELRMQPLDRGRQRCLQFEHQHVAASASVRLPRPLRQRGPLLRRAGTITADSTVIGRVARRHPPPPRPPERPMPDAAWDRARRARRGGQAPRLAAAPSTFAASTPALEQFVLAIGFEPAARPADGAPEPQQHPVRAASRTTAQPPASIRPIDEALLRAARRLPGLLAHHDRRRPRLRHPVPLRQRLSLPSAGHG